MNTLKRLAASTILALALVVGTFAPALAQEIWYIYECELTHSVIDWRNETVTHYYDCSLTEIWIFLEQ